MHGDSATCYMLCHVPCIREECARRFFKPANTQLAPFTWMKDQQRSSAQKRALEASLIGWLHVACADFREEF